MTLYDYHLGSLKFTLAQSFHKNVREWHRTCWNGSSTRPDYGVL